MQKTGKLEAYPTLLPATISAVSNGERGVGRWFRALSPNRRAPRWVAAKRRPGNGLVPLQGRAFDPTTGNRHSPPLPEILISS
jgi:hypothetical protein